MEYKLALIGFGNVGQGLAEILAQRTAVIADKFQTTIKIVAICDFHKGSIADPDGFDPGALLTHLSKHGDLGKFPAAHHGWDAKKTINDSGANVLVELAYTDLKTGEPALTHMAQALKMGMHVSTTNKGPVALHFPKLLKLSETYGGQIGVEGTVMSGTPTLALAMKMLTAAGITRIQGILNGTTNFILGEMERGASYTDALQTAQEKGYAEADPSGDVEGHDAAAKVVILANLLMDQPMTLSDVDCTGIVELTIEDIKVARNNDQHWKLLATIESTEDGRFLGKVQPTKLNATHPLANIGGASNAISYTTDLLGDVTLIGPGAGRIETGYAVIADILAFSDQETSNYEIALSPADQ